MLPFTTHMGVSGRLGNKKVRTGQRHGFILCAVHYARFHGRAWDSVACGS